METVPIGTSPISAGSAEPAILRRAASLRLAGMDAPAGDRCDLHPVENADEPFGASSDGGLSLVIGTLPFWPTLLEVLDQVIQHCPNSRPEPIGDAALPEGVGRLSVHHHDVAVRHRGPEGVDVYDVVRAPWMTSKNC